MQSTLSWTGWLASWAEPTGASGTTHVHLYGVEPGLMFHFYRVLTSCAGHALFLLVAMLVVVFVKVPAMARVFLLVAVVANAIIDVKMGVALTFTALGAVATIVIVCK